MSDRKPKRHAGERQVSARPKRKRYKPDTESRWLEFGQRLTAAIALMAPQRGGHYTMADLARDLVPKLKETPVRTSEPDSSTIGLWSRNVQRPSLEKILLLAECLKVDPGWLAFGSYATKATWPTWAVNVWPETGGEVPGERDARYKPRSHRSAASLIEDAYPAGSPTPPAAFTHEGQGSHRKRGRRRA